MLFSAHVVEDRRHLGAVGERRFFGAQQEPDLAVTKKRRLRRLERIVAVADAFDLAPLKRNDRVGNAAIALDQPELHVQDALQRNRNKAQG